MKKYPQLNIEIQNTNKGRLKYFSLIIGIICIPNILILDLFLLDLNFQLDLYLFYSHILLATISFFVFSLNKRLNSPRIISLVTYSYIISISLIETIVSGWLDQVVGRGSYLYVATIMIFCLTFYIGTIRTIIYLALMHSLFVFLNLRFQMNSNLLLGSVGNGSVFVIIAFVMQLVVQKQKYNEIEKSEAIINFVEKETLKAEQKAIKKKYKNSPLSSEEKEKIVYKLTTIFENHKPFLKSDISISQIAEMIGTNSSYLSQTINATYGKNFNCFINEYRINEAIKLMNHELGRVMTIEGIASHVGFNSKSAFYGSFKQCKGQTPSEYFKGSEILPMI